MQEKIRWALLLAIPLAFLGLFLIVGIGWTGLDPQYKIGVYFGLAAAGYAGFLLSLRKLQIDQRRQLAGGPGGSHRHLPGHCKADP